MIKRGNVQAESELRGEIAGLSEKIDGLSVLHGDDRVDAQAGLEQVKSDHEKALQEVRDQLAAMAELIEGLGRRIDEITAAIAPAPTEPAAVPSSPAAPRPARPAVDRPLRSPLPAREETRGWRG